MPTGGQDDYVATPGGWWYHRSCVHAIEQGARVDRNRVVHRRDGTTYQIPKCAYRAYNRVRPGAGPLPPADNGWIEWADIQEPAGNWFSQQNAKWTVPTAPLTSYGSGQVYYTFPGIQSDSFILQPVLQFGTSPAGGGNFWALASWQCDGPSGYCAHSTPLVTASAGDTLSGTVASSACANGVCTWTVTALDVKTGSRTVLTTSDTANYFDGVGASLEVYGVTTCDQYPRNGVFFTNISLYDRYGTLVSPSWVSHQQSGLSPGCNFAVSTTTTSVTLYQNRPPTATVSGPTDITQAGTYTWTANPSGGVGGYSYSWQYRDAINPNWVGAGGLQSVTKTVNSSTASWFDYMVTVTSGDQTGFGSVHVISELGQCNPFC